MQKVISGQLVNYEVLGEKRKKDLLILHGWGGSLAEWRSIAENLSARYKVWLVDFPGFGNSPRPPDSWTIYDYADLTADFIKSTGIKKCLVMGHSFGGRVAIVLGSKIQDLISKLVLVDAAGLRMKSLKSTVAGYIFDWFGPIKKYIPNNFKNLIGSADYKSAGPMRKIFVKTVSQDLTVEITQLKILTLIIWGEKDLVLPIVEAAMIKHLIGKSVMRVVWGADHWPHLSKKDEFLNILEEEGI